MAVPIGAPFPDAASHIHGTVRAGALRETADGLKFSNMGKIAEFGKIHFISPWIEISFGSSRGFFPLRLGRQPLPHPSGVSVGFIPTDANHGVVGFR